MKQQKSVKKQIFPVISPPRGSTAFTFQKTIIYFLPSFFAKVIFMCILCDHAIQKSFYLTIVFKTMILSSTYSILGYRKLDAMNLINWTSVFCFCFQFSPCNIIPPMWNQWSLSLSPGDVVQELESVSKKYSHPQWMKFPNSSKFF